MDGQSISDKLGSPQTMRSVGSVALGLLALFLLAATLYAFQSMRFIGSGVSATNTITVSGEGEIFAVPDIATFSVTIEERADTVEAAQETATEKSNDIIAYLKEQGIDEKDIRTADYSAYPRYEYSERICASNMYCPPGDQVLAGYTVSQTLSVKVRDTDKAGGVLSGVGSRGASQVSGLSFTIDDEDELNLEVRGMAIDDARTKAAELAKQLNVRLIRVVGFSENGSYPPMPYAYGMGGDVAVRSEAALKIAPDIPTGENKIISSVTITYEIR